MPLPAIGTTTVAPALSEDYAQQVDQLTTRDRSEQATVSQLWVLTSWACTAVTVNGATGYVTAPFPTPEQPALVSLRLELPATGIAVTVDVPLDVDSAVDELTAHRTLDKGAHWIAQQIRAGVTGTAAGLTGQHNAGSAGNAA